MKSIHVFHQAQVRLRATLRTKPAEIVREREILQRYYDLQRLSPTGAIDDGLERCARMIEAKYAAKHQRTQSLLGEVNAAKRDALAAIGKHFGGLAKLDGRGDAQVRFQRWWNRANQYRKSHLDGIALHRGMYDPEGPMFKAFVKAMGLRYYRDGSFSQT